MHKKKIIPALTGMLLLLWVLSGMTAIYCHAEEVPVSPLTASDRGTDVILVVDNSGSIWNKQNLRNSALKTATHLAVGSDTRIGCVYFADHVYKYFSLADVSDETSFKEISRKYLDFTEQDVNNMYTNIGRGLEKGLELFENQDENRRRIMIVLSDGINDGKGKTSDSYQKEADELTEAQTRILRDKNIELYCVAIGGGGQTDEDYLRQMVNYFDITNTYDEERCFWVKQDNLSELYEHFIHIFYSLRGDVKYSQIHPDAEGVYSFSLPQLNVKRVQAYVNTGAAQVTLSNPAGDAVVEWKDDNSIFVSADHPSPGEWTLRVVPADGASLPDHTKVTLAYYTDLLASGSLRSADKERDMPVKNKQVYIQAHLYDAEGHQIVPDKAVKASAHFVLQDNRQATLMEKEFPLTVEGDSLVSEAFELTDYGVLSMDLHVGYSDAVSLDYQLLREQEIGPAAPTVIKNFDGQNVRVEKVTKDGKEFYQFSVPLQEYIKDADSPLQQLRITGITQHNDHNPVSAYIDHEKLVIELQKCEPFSGYIIFADEMNQTAELSVKGSVVDMNWDTTLGRVMAVLAAIAVAAIIVAFVLFCQKKKAKRDIIEIQNQIALQSDKIKKRAQGTISDASDASYTQAINDVNKFLMRNDVFPEYLAKVREEIQGHEVLSMDREIKTWKESGLAGLQQCRQAAKDAWQLLTTPEAKPENSDSLKQMSRKKLCSLRDEKAALMKELDKFDETSKNGYQALQEANAALQDYDNRLNQAAASIQQRLANWQTRKFDFSVRVSIDHNGYSYTAHPECFVMPMSKMMYLGGNDKIHMERSRVIFLAYQRTETVVEDGQEVEKLIPGISVWWVNKDGAITKLVDAVDVGSQNTFTDPDLQKDVHIQVRPTRARQR